MTPSCQAPVLGDALSVAEAGNSQVKLLCSGHFLLELPCPASNPLARHRGLDSGLMGILVCISKKLGVGLAGKEGLFGS